MPHKFLSKTALKFQKPLAGEKPSFISNAFRILQNNWFTVAMETISKVPKYGYFHDCNSLVV